MVSSTGWNDALYRFPDINVKNEKIKFSFVVPEWPKARTNKLGILMILILFVEVCLLYDTWFLVWLRTGCNSKDIKNWKN